MSTSVFHPLTHFRMTTEIPPQITTPGRLETRLGPLAFTGGFTDDAMVQKVCDNLDFQRGVQAFLTAMPAASLAAIHKGIIGFGPANETVILFEAQIAALQAQQAQAAAQARLSGT